MKDIDQIMAENEIEWYFNYAEADLGISSNWGPMVMASLLPGGGYHDQMSSSFLDKISKHREIEKAFHKLSIQFQKCLYTSFGSMQPPAIVTIVYKELAPLALCSKILSPDNLIKYCERLKKGKLSDKEKSIISEIRREAEKLKINSIKEYIKMRKNEE